MNREMVEMIKEMAQQVTFNQNCVLELIVSDSGMAAHLIPADIYREMEEEDYCDE